MAGSIKIKVQYLEVILLNGGYTLKNQKKRSSPAFKVSTAIVVAIIGCAGTFITALFGYLAIKAQTEIPIKITQTAVALQEYLTSNAPTETAIPPTSIIPTETPRVAWDTILKSSTGFSSPCGTKVIPESVSMNPNNLQASLANFNDSFSKDVGRDWNSAIETNLFLDLESYSQLNWVKVENRFSLNIFVESEVPDNLNIVEISGCGGGYVRYLQDVTLTNQNNLKQYTVSLTYPDVDFFTLKPGEFETFFIPLECKAPGIYSFNIVISSEYTDQSGDFTIVPLTKMYCPYSFNKYESGNNLEYAGKFEWNGNEYQKVP